MTSEWAALFAARKNYGWPEGIAYQRPDELPALLRQRNLKAYHIHSSYRLEGWVLAEGGRIPGALGPPTDAPMTRRLLNLLTA